MIFAIHFGNFQYMDVQIEKIICGTWTNPVLIHTLSKHGNSVLSVQATKCKSTEMERSIEWTDMLQCIIVRKTRIESYPLASIYAVSYDDNGRIPSPLNLRWPSIALRC